MSAFITIREGTLEDTEGVQRVYAKSWRQAYSGIISEETLEEETSESSEFYPCEKYRAKIEDDGAIYLVALTKGEVTGIAHFCWEEYNTHQFVEPGTAQLRAIYVDPSFWGQGIGTRLFEDGLDRLPPMTDELMVEYLSENERARGFYESSGFVQEGGRTIELYGDDYETATYRLSR